MYVISIAEHLCRELCEGYSIDLNEIINCDFVRKKRSQIKELIHKVAHEFGSWTLVILGSIRNIQRFLQGS